MGEIIWCCLKLRDLAVHIKLLPSKLSKRSAEIITKPQHAEACYFAIHHTVAGCSVVNWQLITSPQTKPIEIFSGPYESACMGMTLYAIIHDGLYAEQL